MYQPPPSPIKLLLERVRNIILILLPFAVIYGVFWVVSNRPEFKIKNIRVEGNITIPKEFIINGAKKEVLENRSLIGKIFPEDNIFIWKETRLQKIIAEKPKIIEATLTKNKDREITIKVSERTEHAVWCAVEGDNKNCYWMSKDGVIFADAPDTEGSLMRVIYDYSGTPIILGNQPINGDELQVIERALKLSEELKLNIREVSIKNRNLKEFSIKFYDDPDIMFSTLFDPYINKKVVESGMKLSEWRSLEYFDARIENKGFYKIKGAPVPETEVAPQAIEVNGASVQG